MNLARLRSTFAALAILLSLGYWIDKATIEVPEVILPALHASPPPCAVTYGPWEIPRAGWVAYGVVCPEGREP
jgi:hypothetical protein